MRLENKSVVVTGASAGIGRAIVELFVSEGANVVAVARRESMLAELAASLADAPGRVVPFVGDIAEEATSVGMIACAVREFGRLDVLVNDAGVMDDNTAIADMSNDMLEQMFRVNTFGTMYAMREAVKTFLAQGEEEGGNIINIVSVGAAHQTAGVAYCASKAAVASATRNTAFMYIEQGIRCNAISPGGVLTDIPLVMPPADPFGFGRTGSLLAHSPEMGMPEDLAQVALFLASDESRFVNGTTITADGGWTCF